jgi:hypothetical protein
MNQPRQCHQVVFILACLLQTGLAHAAKTDIVKLVNGNEITGEIKGLDFGELSYSTDSMGTVSIDWEDIVAVISEQGLQVEITDGRRYYGQLLRVPGERNVSVRTADGDIALNTEQIVRITPIEGEGKFFERLDGSLGLGFQAQKSSEVNTSYVAADVSYRTQKYLVGVRLNSTVTDQPSEETTASQSLFTNYQRFRPNRWFADWFTGWERNDEQGIAGRISGGAAWGRYFVQTNQNEFSVAAGAQLARERYYGEDPSDTVVEGRLEVRYLHRNIAPDTSFNVTSTYYPLLDDVSDYRAESDLTFRREFIEDVYLDLGLNYSYQSNPPSGGAKSDYAVTTSLSYEF